MKYGMMMFVGTIAFVCAAADMTGNWRPYPADTLYHRSGGVHTLTVSPGREGVRGLALAPSKMTLPAGASLRIAFWHRTEDGAPVPGKNAQLGLFATVAGASGKHFYPAIGVPRSDEWRFYEKTFTFPEAVTSVRNVYLTAYHFSGKTHFSDVRFGAWNPADAVEEDRPVLSVGSTPVTLDGFVVLRKGTPAQNATRVSLRCDEKNLNLSFRCASKQLDPAQQQLSHFKAAVEKDGVRVLSDDSVELFLGCADGSILQLGCNANGMRFTARNGNEVSAPWQAKGARREHFWTADVTIPWTSLGFASPPRDPLLFSVARNDRAAGEASSYCALQGAFNDQDRFALLRRDKDAAGLTEAPIIPVSVNPGRVTFTARSSAAGTISLQSVQPGKGRMTRCEAKANESVELDSVFSPGGSYRIRTVLHGRDGRLLFRSPWRNAVCSAALTAQITDGAIQAENKTRSPARELALKRGENKLVPAKGSVTLAVKNPAAPQPEQITFSSPHTVAVNVARPIAALDLSTGLHWERNGAQHLPILSNPAKGKTLELLLPPHVTLIGRTNISRSEVRYADIRYTLCRWRAPEQATGTFTFPVVLRLAADAPEQLPPLRYRTTGANFTECWNAIPIRVLPAISVPSKTSIPLRVLCTFGVGDIDEEGAEAVVRTLAQSGFNIYMERRACYGNEHWVNAARKARIALTAELHLRAIFGMIGSIESLMGKAHYLPGPVHTLTVTRRSEVEEKIRRFVARVRPDAMEMDLEFPPTREFDASDAARKRFAQWAKLRDTPSKEELKTTFKKQWAEFCARDIAEFARIVREAVKKTKPDCAFGVYSAYQSAHHREVYGIDWRLFRNIADYGVAGYGRPSEILTRATRDAAGTMPFSSGILTEAMRHTALRNLGNEILWRIADGYNGIMCYTWVSFDGLARSQVARAARILSAHEPFFIRPQRENNFSVSGNLLRQDTIVLCKDNRRLLVAFNFGGTPRSGTVKIGIHAMPVTVPPNDCYVKIIPKGPEK